MSIQYIKASGEDIGRIVGRIETAIEGEKNSHVSIACIVVALLAQRPDLEPEELQTIVKNTSEYMAASLYSGTSGTVN